MHALRRLGRGLLNSIRHRRLERDLDEELAFHLTSRSEDLVRQGLSDRDARQRARREFGGVERYKDEHRDARTLRALENAARDLVHAWRSLRRSPTLVVASVLSLACGVSVNALLFSALNNALFITPTAFEPDRLVWVEPGNSNQFSYLNYRDLADSGVFTDVVGYRWARLNVRANNQTAPAEGLAVTANFFDVLGIQTVRGRPFTAREAAAESRPRLAVLSDGFWRRSFQGDPAVVGREVTVNGEPLLILGVLGPRYRPLTPLTPPDIYVPLSPIVLSNLSERRNSNALTVLGRLGPGATPAQAHAAVVAFSQDLERRHPVENRGMGRPERTFVYGFQRQSPRRSPVETLLVPATFTLLFALVLLIGCANVAGLLLARSAGRQREIAVRGALGASRARLVQTLLAESYLLSFIGAGVGLLAAVWAIPSLSTLSFAGLGRIAIPLTIDLKLVAYGFGLFLLTGTVSGILPALRAARVDVTPLLQQGGGHGATARLRMRHALVVTEVAAAVVLLVVSSLLVRSLMRAATIDAGFDIDHGVVARVELDPNRYSRGAAVLAGDRIVERIEAIPGVASASVADIIPLGGDASAGLLVVDGATTDEPVRVFFNSVGPRYFETLGIPLLRGREFRPTDRPGSPPAVVVSRAFAQAVFPGQEVIGRLIRTENSVFGTVVGVVEDSAYQSLAESASPILYFAHAQRAVSDQYRPLTVHVRPAASPASIFRPVREVASAFDRDVTTEVNFLSAAAGVELRLRRLITTILSTVGALGLLLAMIGLYGVMAFVVTSRTTEIGVRMALGASRGRVLRDQVWKGTRLVLVGLGLGLAVSLAVTRPLGTFLLGLSPTDPVAYAVVALVLLLVGVCASYLPARRATGVDPLTALRAE